MAEHPSKGLGKANELLAKFEGSGQPSPCMNSFSPGNLTSIQVQQLAGETGGMYEQPLYWLAKQMEFKKFISHDGLPLQSYHLPSVSSPKPAIVFCAGWTETTLKYGKLFQVLQRNNFPVFSFDLRCQGFSGSTLYNEGPVSYTENFMDYVKDLETFVNSYVKKNTSCNDIIYLGTSMATVIGLLAAKRDPSLFSRLVLIAPALRPTVSLFEKGLLYGLRTFGQGQFLLTRFTDTIADIPCTHEMENRLAYLRLRKLCPILQVQGPTVSWVCELIKGSAAVMEAPVAFSNMEILMFRAELDNYVDGPAMSEFAAAAGKRCKVHDMNKSFHEILQETDNIFDEATRLMIPFFNGANVDAKENALKATSKGDSNTFMIILIVVGFAAVVISTLLFA